MKPLVSVIITTHKGSTTINRCIQSVLKQNYENIEIIVVDDNGLGSDEQIKTESIVSSISSHINIVYKAHEINKNGSAARNTGFFLSQGVYIGFIDDDDQYLPGKISKSVDMLFQLDQNWGGCYTDAIIDMGPNEKFKTSSKNEGDILFETLCHTIFMNPSTLLLKREIVEKIQGYDATFFRHQDFEFNARVANVCKLKHLDILGSIYDCQTHRHYNKDKAVEYRSYYLSKMRPLIAKFSHFKQNVIAARNAVEILGVKINKYQECKQLCRNWGYNMNIFHYLYTLIITFVERKKIAKIIYAE